MDFGIFYEIQVASPLKNRHREYEVFHQVLAQVEGSISRGESEPARRKNSPSCAIV